jgi:putative glycosyltransferase (TIGR04372 family)
MSVMAGVLQGMLLLNRKIFRSLIKSLTCLAGAMADHGELERARDLYDEMYLLQPEQYEVYIRQYDALGDRVWMNMGKTGDSLSYWTKTRELQTRLAQENGLLPSDVTYLSQDWSTAYGHIALIHYAVKRNLLLDKPKRLIVLATKGCISNEALLDYYKPWVEIEYSPEVKRSLPAVLLADRLNILQSESGRYDHMMDVFHEITNRWQEQGRPPLVTFSEEDRQRGEALLSKLGADPKQWFVCLHVRYSTDSRGRHSRNADLETYGEAVQAIVRAGGNVIRIGPVLDKPCGIPNLIDYASSDLRTEWGDVFLSGACRFFLGTASGPCVIPELFGVPVIITNSHPFGVGPFSGRCILKLLWHEKEKRYLSLSEMLEPPFALTERNAVIEEQGVRLVDNTPEELGTFVEEILQTLDGKMTYTQQEQDDQATFRSIMKRVQPNFPAHCGTAFLTKHRHLLS